MNINVWQLLRAAERLGVPTEIVKTTPQRVGASTDFVCTKSLVGEITPEPPFEFNRPRLS